MHIISLLMGIVLMAACQNKPAAKESYMEANLAYGERVSMEVCLDKNSRQDIKDAMKEAWAAVASIQPMIDIWDHKSDVALINRSFKHPVEVSPKVYDLLKEAVGYNALTQGAFDVTTGPLIQLWKNAGTKGKMPTEKEIERARKGIGVKNIAFWPRHKVELLDKDTRIDLGGLGANVAVDEAVKVFRKYGYRDFMVAAAGDMYMSGNNCEGKPWQIGVLNPMDKTKLFDVLSLSDMAVSTSGDYERFAVIEGRRFSHVINPATGYPQTSATSGTAIAPGVKEAGALAKALIILEPQKATALMDALGAPYAGLVLYKDSDGQMKPAPSKQYASYYSKN